jgi:transposase-like protein
MPRRRITDPAERRAIVAEVLRRYGAGEGTYRALSEQLGVRENEFQYWRRLYPPQPEAPIAPASPVADAVPPKPNGLKHPSAPYPPAERERLRQEIERLRATGVSTERACKTVGIRPESYRRWRDAVAPAAAMRPVEVTALVPVRPQALSLVPPQPAAVPPEVAEAQGLALLAPGGYRVEGLSVETAAALLRALS